MSLATDPARSPTRTDGYAPIRDYAVIGNKRTAALVAIDGSIDWLPLPAFDQPTVFANLLDAQRGGSFALAPSTPFTVERGYVEDTNVLQTTFRTADGAVRVTDAMSRPIARGLLFNQVIRRVDGLSGTVEMAWKVRPRFDYAEHRVTPRRVDDRVVYFHRQSALAIESAGVGEVELNGDDAGGLFTLQEGQIGVLALSAFDDEPLTFSAREHLLERLDATTARWRAWMSDLEYAGRWSDAVRRSALALDLLVDDESGAIAAAATMGLPERIGGPRNYDYRYAWLRDSNLTLEAMLRLGFRDQVHSSLTWMFRTMRRTHPRLRPMYGLDGSVRLQDRPLPLEGYRGSAPVLLGNGAQDQLQLGNYGDVFDMTWHYVHSGGRLVPDDGLRLAEAADFVCRIWRNRDAGIWELHDPQEFTQGKLACWLALDRAITLAEGGVIPSAHLGEWRRSAGAIERFVTTRCWSSAQEAYARAADSDELDAAVLLAARGSFLESDQELLSATIDAIRRELGAGGPLLYRYSGMENEEGAFLACSFWCAEALARAGRRDEAVEMMDALIGLANDVGLFSEEIDPGTGAFLGNLPQALTHLALVNAAAVISERPGE